MFTLNFKTGRAKSSEGILRFMGIHFPQIHNVFILMLLGTSGNVKGPMKPLRLTLDSPDYTKSPRKLPATFRHISSNTQTLTTRTLRTFRKRRVPTNPWGPSYQILRILLMGSISIKKYENEILYFSTQL